MSKVEKTITEMRSVRIHFSKEEKEKMSTELAESCKTKQEAEAEKKSVVSQLKAKIDAQDSRISYLSNCISTGYSFRSVECVVKKDFEKGVKEFYHEGTLVDTIPLTQEDSQLSINDHAAKFRDDMDKAGFEVQGFDRDTNTLTMKSKE